MANIPNIIPITDLRQNASEIVKMTGKTGKPVFITQRGRATAVMISMESYKKYQKEYELLKMLAKGEQEISAGKGHDMEDVMAEAQALLKELHG